MKPTAIKQTDAETITVTWDDRTETPLPITLLRDECPCAECKGETILMQQILPVLKPKLPGHYSIQSITPVGSYAIQISWGDGHATGLYSWDYLRALPGRRT
ncbi:MAG: DUF971 domain-containing protein [Bacteroidetes bacterium]|nr:DUF971 domain-containing protein [Bacteroidota bacterium]